MVGRNQFGSDDDLSTRKVNNSHKLFRKPISTPKQQHTIDQMSSLKT